jgi:hypothetical protein
MNWKQFLKLDWKKIVVFVILIFIAMFSIGIPFWSYPMCEPGGSCPLIFNFLPSDKIISSNIYLNNGFRIDWIILFFILLLLYLFSCLIVRIYDKVKKKK